MKHLQTIEYADNRVLTTQQLAEVYETTVDNIKMNFKRNKDRFTEGKHYYMLKGDELRDFKNRVTGGYSVPRNVNALILWTEKGADRHCKILDTDKAWEQFDNLEETYFRVKEQTAISVEGLSTEMQALLMHDRKLVEQDKRITALENNEKISSGQKRDIRKAINAAVISACGGEETTVYRKHSQKIYKAIYGFLYTYFDISEYADIPRTRFTDATERIKEWYPSCELKLFIEKVNGYGQQEIDWSEMDA